MRPSKSEFEVVTVYRCSFLPPRTQLCFTERIFCAVAHLSLTGSRFSERDTTRLHNELVPASVGVVLSSISMYTEAPLVMARIYAPHEYCVKRVKFSQVAEGLEARAIDFDLIEMAGDLLKCTPTHSSPALPEIIRC